MSDLLNVRMSELRTCRGPCGETKPLVEGFYRNMGTYYKYHCKVCSASANRAWRARQKDAPRYAERPPLIPGPDPWLDLQVIEACWQSCVDEGAPAIKRMMAKIVDSCKGVHGSTWLRDAALDYLAGIGDLAMVQRALGECVGLAVVS